MSYQVTELLKIVEAEVQTLLAKTRVSVEVETLLKDYLLEGSLEITKKREDAIRDETAYLGFDPKKIMQKFLCYAKADLKREGDKPMKYKTPGGHEFQLYERCDPYSDLLFLIDLFLEVDNNVLRILLKCGQDVENIIRRKETAYAIVSGHLARTSIDNSSLTLARLSRASPLATASLIIKNNISGKLKTKALAEVSTLPIIMQHSVFPSLIPTDQEDLREDLKTVAIVLKMETSILLTSPKEKRKLEKRDVKDLAAQAEQFVSEAMTGSLIDDKTKFEILRIAMILDGNDRLSPLAQACVMSARAFLQLGSKSYLDAVRARTEELNALVK